MSFVSRDLDNAASIVREARPLPHDDVRVRHLGQHLTHDAALDRSTGLEGGEQWYVAYTKPHREAGAQQQLEAQGFKTFLPRYRKTVRHARRLITVKAAFFPRYLFVALDIRRQPWRSVNGTFGVVSLVMDDVFPRPVHRGVVEALYQACDDESLLHMGRSLELGDRVRVLSGPFADLVGELIRIDGSRRVQVLLRLLGGVVRASIDRRDLTSAHSA